MHKSVKHIFFFSAAFIIAVVSCSPLSKLPADKYRLKSNLIVIEGDKTLNPANFNTYVRQQPSSFRLFSDPVEFNPDLIEASEQNLKTHLEHLGYYHSGVESKVKISNRDAIVTYTIKPGKRLVIDSLIYILPEVGSLSEDFFSDSLNFIIHKGDYLSEQTLTEESTRASSYLRTKGYYAVNTSLFSYEADTITIPGKLLLSMKLGSRNRSAEKNNDDNLYSKYRFGRVTISHSEDIPFDETVLKALNTIKAGEQYNEDDVFNTYKRLSSLRVFSNVGIDQSPSDDHQVDCAISLSESKERGFKANLEASTNSNGLIGITPQLSFYHKNIFHGGEWLNLSFLGNFQFKFKDSIHSNEYAVSAGLSLPRFLGLPYKTFGNRPNIPRTEINASFNYQNRPEYTRSLFATSFGYTGALGDHFFYKAYPLQLGVVRLGNMSESFNKVLEENPYLRYSYNDHFDSGIGTTLYYTTDNSVVPKSSYHYARLSFDVSGNFVSLFRGLMKKDALGKAYVFGLPYSQYARGELTLGKTWKFGIREKDALATRFLIGAGYAYGNSSSLPFEKQFYSGGANSMRGWQARSLGPGYSAINTSFSIPSQSGDAKLEMNVEYRRLLFWKIESALFLDAGNIWMFPSKSSTDPASEFRFKDFYKNIAMNWGIGLRLNLDLMVLRVDMGIKLYEPSRTLTGSSTWLGPNEWFKKNGFAIHLGVGYPF